MHKTNKKNMYIIKAGDSEGKRRLENLEVDCRIILRQILNK
jgi:hypothetical protein